MVTVTLLHQENLLEGVWGRDLDDGWNGGVDPDCGLVIEEVHK